MRDIGAALEPGVQPDPDHMRELYARHASRILGDHPVMFTEAPGSLEPVPLEDRNCAVMKKRCGDRPAFGVFG
jgi:hypothetical protein